MGFYTLQCQVINTNNTTHKKITPLKKEYLCIQTDGRNPRAAQCTKSWVLPKYVKTIISIVSFEQKCVIIKVLLKSGQLKQHMGTIGVDQSLSSIALYEHKCLVNIKIYTNHLKSVMININTNP